MAHNKPNKVYIVTTTGYGDDEGTSIVCATLDKKKADDIEQLWSIVCKYRHSYPKFGHKTRSMIALDILQKRYHIITWSGRSLSIQECELQ